MFRKIRRYMNDPYYALGYDMIKDHPNWMSDKFYLKVLWRMVMGYELDLKNPQTFNEKLQWLKLYDHNPLYTLLVDKYRVKDWVKERIGEQYVIPTLAVYNSADEIQLESLPKQFVLKCNHDSGSVFICRDNSMFDLLSAKKQINKYYHHNFYKDAREWAYKNVKPIIFAEQFMQDDNLEDLVTYKFLCFNGTPAYMYVTVKNEYIWENWYDRDFFPVNVKHTKFPTSPCVIKKPKCFDEMWSIAAELSTGIPHVRIDLYEVNGQVYFSEYSFYDWGGLMKFETMEMDKNLGSLIKL